MRVIFCFHLVNNCQFWQEKLSSPLQYCIEIPKSSSVEEFYSWFFSIVCLFNIIHLKDL